MAFHSELAHVLLAQLGWNFHVPACKMPCKQMLWGDFQVCVTARCTRGCCVCVMGYLPLVAYVFTPCLRYPIAQCLGEKKKKKAIGEIWILILKSDKGTEP